MKKFEIIFVVMLVLYLSTAGIREFSNDYEKLQDDVVRIHILANSDSEEDQALKLRVRDIILESTAGWTDGCSSADEAADVFQSRIDDINSIAQDYVCSEGYGYETLSEVVDMDFDDRVYGDITMPHGNYKAVRVKIGSAEGHNWWCVMYPPLCVPAAGDRVDIDDYSEYFSEGEIDIMKNCGKYKVKLRCAEIYNDVKKILKDF